ncbi:MAG: BLUF domain-containing protein [Beijerinckiaceae bacterium]|nr:BLUF domain-containing protein [Beijerinckiaceae bacterium]
MLETCLVYFSKNRLDPLDGPILRQLSKILNTSNKNNRPAGLTGALVFDDEWFLQSLEGERNEVWKAFKRIEADERHADVVVVEVKAIQKRVFGNWWMGLARRGDATEQAFRPHLRDGKLKPDAMTGDEILALMTGLAQTGMSRKLAPSLVEG